MTYGRRGNLLLKFVSISTSTPVPQIGLSLSLLSFLRRFGLSGGGWSGRYLSVTVGAFISRRFEATGTLVSLSRILLSPGVGGLTSRR